jgi:hypothetical protein
VTNDSVEVRFFTDFVVEEAFQREAVFHLNGVGEVVLSGGISSIVFQVFKQRITYKGRIVTPYVHVCTII